MESAVTAPVSGHVKRVVVHEGRFFSAMYIYPSQHLSSRRLHQPRRSRRGDRSLTLRIRPKYSLKKVEHQTHCKLRCSSLVPPLLIFTRLLEEMRRCNEPIKG
jgi:hypothetical protein